MTAVTRFAPSPTAICMSAIYAPRSHNYLLSARVGGRFLLRIDDTDPNGQKEEYVASIVADLDWLGLIPNAVFRQSERFALYEREFDRLKAAGRVFACYETPEELDVRRKVLLGAGFRRSMNASPPTRPCPME